MAALFWAATLLVICNAAVYTTNNDIENDLNTTITALDKLITYYKLNVKSLNLDGFFGLRVLEGQLQLLISEHTGGRHQHLQSYFIKQIKLLHQRIQNTTAIGIEFVKRDDFRYYSDFSTVIAAPWMTMKPHRKLQPSLRWEIPQYKAKVKVKLTEELSDKCMTELMHGAGKGCVISEECEKIMTTRGLTGYDITHQLLWSVIGELMPNCSQSVDKAVKEHGMGNISSMQLEMCTNNFYEMVAVVQVLMHGKVQESHQDLFLEQQFVCPNLGFYEFLKKDYLDQIISWQFPSGCFGEHTNWDDRDDNELDFTDLLKGYHEGNGNFNLHGNKNQEKAPVEKMELKRDIPEEAPELEIKKEYAAIWQPKSNNIVVDHPTKIRVPRHIVMPKTLKSKLFNQTFQDSAYANKNNKVAVSTHQNVIQQQRNQNAFHQGHIRDVQHVLRDSSPTISKSRVNIAKVEPSKNLPVYNNDAAARKQSFQHTSFNQEPRQFHNGHSPDGKRFGRRLLVEKEMEGGCLSHKTGVAAGALVMYLRYLIDPGDIKWTGQHELFLSDTRNLLQAINDAQQQGGDAAESLIENEEDEDEEEEEEDIEDEEEEYVPLDGLKADEEQDEEENEEEEDDGYNQDDGDSDDGHVDGKEDFNQEKNNGNNGKNEIKDNSKEMMRVDNQDVKAGVKALNQRLQTPGKAELNVEDGADHEEDPSYYDDEGETGRGIIRKQKPITQRPNPPLRIRRKYSGDPVSQESLYAMGQGELTADHPNYFVILLVSVAPFFILIFFLCKFIRKRRVHIRYYR